MQTTYKWRDFEFTFTLKEQSVCLAGTWYEGTLSCKGKTCDVEGWDRGRGSSFCSEALDWVVVAARRNCGGDERSFLESIGFPLAEYYRATTE